MTTKKSDGMIIPSEFFITIIYKEINTKRNSLTQILD